MNLESLAAASANRSNAGPGVRSERPKVERWTAVAMTDDSPPPRTPRRAARVQVDAAATIRRMGRRSYQVHVYDVTALGCKVEIVDHPLLDERLWIKFDDLEPLPALVCWIEGSVAGLEFENAIHPAVFEMLVSRLT